MATIHPAMERKVHKIISAICMESYIKANTSKTGKRYKKARPYSVPEIADDMVKAIGEGDAEQLCGLIHRYEVGAFDQA